MKLAAGLSILLGVFFSLPSLAAEEEGYMRLLDEGQPAVDNRAVDTYEPGTFPTDPYTFTPPKAQGMQFMIPWIRKPVDRDDRIDPHQINADEICKIMRAGPYKSYEIGTDVSVNLWNLVKKGKRTVKFAKGLVQYYKKIVCSAPDKILAKEFLTVEISTFRKDGHCNFKSGPADVQAASSTS